MRRKSFELQCGQRVAGDTEESIFKTLGRVQTTRDKGMSVMANVPAQADQA